MEKRKYREGVKLNKVVLLLATQKGHIVLKRLLESGFSENIKFVCSFREVAVEKSWDEDIYKLCDKYSVEHLNWKEGKLALDNINVQEVTAVIAIGWKYILDDKLNTILKYGIITLHDSLLPKYRGFAPTPTAIICGENEVGVSAIFSVNEMDAGDIICQRKIELTGKEYIKEIIERQASIYAEIVLEVVGKIVNNISLDRHKQDESLATYSVWRNIDDCRIDWKDSATHIYNLIRAVSAPYHGAYFMYENQKIVVCRAEIIEDKVFAIRDVGKIWKIRDNCAEIICGHGMIRITEAHKPNGEIFEFTKVRVRL